jgi:hypothetical protein
MYGYENPLHVIRIIPSLVQICTPQDHLILVYSFLILERDMNKSRKKETHLVPKFLPFQSCPDRTVELYPAPICFFRETVV